LQILMRKLPSKISPGASATGRATQTGSTHINLRQSPAGKSGNALPSSSPGFQIIHWSKPLALSCSEWLPVFSTSGGHPS
jgi:hypothetical protein